MAFFVFVCHASHCLARCCVIIRSICEPCEVMYPSGQCPFAQFELMNNVPHESGSQTRTTF